MEVNREPGNPQADAASSASPGVGKSRGEVQAEFPSLPFIFLWSCSCELLSLTTRGQAAVRNEQDPESPAPSEPPSCTLPSHNPLPSPCSSSRFSQACRTPRSDGRISLLFVTDVSRYNRRCLTSDYGARKPFPFPTKPCLGVTHLPIKEVREIFYKPIPCLAHRSETQGTARNLFATPSLPVVLFLVPVQLMLRATPTQGCPQAEPLTGAVPKKGLLSP